MRRAALPHATLAAIATLGSAGAMGAIMDDGGWFWPLLLAVLVILVSGTVLRWVRTPALLVAAAQVVLALGSLAVTFAGGTLSHGLLPTTETFTTLGTQVRDGLRLMFTYQAPLVHARSVDLLVASAMALTAVAVDLIATRRRHPVLTGVPLAWPLVLCAVARPDAWTPWPFVVAALPWVALLGLEGLRRARGWSSVAARAGAPGEDVQDRRGLGRYAGTARVVALVAVATAALLPIYVPPLGLGTHDGPGAGSGEGEGSSATAQGSRVRFLDTMDLRKDLADRSHRPVLRYRTNDAEPPPLKVMSTSVYTDGRWSKEPTPGPSSAPSTVALRVPPAPGLSRGVPTQAYQITVEGNDLQRPYVAIPAYATGLTASDVTATFDEASGHPLVDRAPLRYTATYVRPRPRTAPTVLADATSPGVSARDLELQGPFVNAVRAEAARAVSGAVTPLEKATAMQAYLRAPGRFRYSLTLEPAPGAPDPLSAFMQTHTGYCVQFATLMVMMARSEGIPARMAYGFLPGSLDADGRRTVTPADAHAWPELYIANLGWVRFEATPSARTGGSAPTYTRVVIPTQVRETATPTATKSSVVPPPPAPAPAAGAGPDARLLLPLLGLLALAGLLAITPLRTRAARRRRRADAAATHEDVWESLLGRLGDLGIPRPVPDTPRRMGAALAPSLHLPTDKDHLRTLVDGLEGYRYRPPGAATSPAEAAWAAHDAIVSSARTAAARRTRVRALLWPSDRPRLLARR